MIQYAVIVLVTCLLLVYFAVELGWGGGDKNDGHPPWPMA